METPLHPNSLQTNRPKRQAALRVERERTDGNSGAQATRYQCNNCHIDITNLIRIKCASCPDFDLCLKCFSVGAELAPHKKTHPYRVMDNLGFSIFEDDWLVDDELLLIDAIELYGVASWTDVSEHVSTKTPFQCKRHFEKIYLEKPDDEIEESLLRYQLMEGEPVKYHQDEPSAEKSEPTGTQPLELAGWQPHRQDFETEYDNTAEEMVKDVFFDLDDTAEEFEVKMKLAQLFNERLEERNKRKQFLIERDLINNKKILNMSRKRTKEERDLITQCSVFARFVPQGEHDEFVAGLLEEHRLRARIGELQEFRKMGLYTLREGDEYTQAKLKRENEKKLRTAKASYLSTEKPKSLGPRSLSDLLAPASSARRPVFSSATILTASPALQKLRQPATPTSSTTRKQSAAEMLDVSEEPGIELLSPQERDLCAVLRVLPHPYLVVKDTLLRACYRMGSLRKSAARKLVRLDPAKTAKIYDFFVEREWITPVPRTEEESQGLLEELKNISLPDSSRPSSKENQPSNSLTSVKEETYVQEI